MAHNERCKECKRSFERLLRATFSDVRVNHDLDLGSDLCDYASTDVFPHLESIYVALQGFRGHRDFVRTSRLPRVDFFVPDRGMIIEFDESQHFTAPRGLTLHLYPAFASAGFPAHKWMELCRRLNKRDNSPAFRDEQRAWYDTVRDFAPSVLGKGGTIRVYSRDETWCELDPGKDMEHFQSSYLGNLR